MKVAHELLIYVENRQVALRHTKSEDAIGLARVAGRLEELQMLITFLRLKNNENIQNWEVKTT